MHFFISIIQWSVSVDTIMSKVAKGKGETHGKMEKTRKCAEEQDNESTDSLQSYDSKGCLLAVNKRNLVRDFLR